MNRLFLTITIIATFLFINSCGNQNSQEDEDKGDTAVTEKIEKPVKTREQLIVNRDTMTIKDIKNPTDFELKHTPEITIGKADEKGYSKIIVKVGSKGIIHPTTDAHWIDFMTLYIDGKKYKHLEFENDNITPKYEFFAPVLKKAKKIKVVIGCNLHGIWSNEIEVK